MNKAYVLLLSYTLAGVCTLAAQPAQADQADYLLVHAPSGGGIWRINPECTSATELSDFGWFADAGRGGGKIVFSEYYNAGIWIMDADGSHKRRLTSVGSDPSLSPDGSRIVFVKGGQNALDHRLWIINADGTGERLLTTRPAHHPDWSNFSDRIVFGNVGGGIFVINADGTDEQRIVGRGGTPSWTPGDDAVVFNAVYIYSVNPNGNGVHRLSTSSGTMPTMGPDGSVVFESTNGLIMLTPRGYEYLWNSGVHGPNWVVNDTSPPYALGPVFSGIGLIPATEIVDGYATTASGYYLQVENAPFGGEFHVFGNFENARADQIARYSVKVGKWLDSTTPPAATEYVQLLESWGNYLWDNSAGKFVYRITAPDTNGRYPVPVATENWYLDDLLIQWNSRNHGDGKYSILLQGYDDTDTPVASAFSGAQLEVVLDNTRPFISIDQILYQGVPVDECAFLELGFQDTLEFVITATDDAGHLRKFYLDGRWGDNHPFGIEEQHYSSAIHGSHWVGVQSTSFFYSDWPTPCAYDFRLRAYDRATDGYKHVNWASYDKLISLLPQ